MAASKKIIAEVERLRNEINQHNYRYHTQDDPVISDAEFDHLFRDLKALEAQYPELISDVSPTQRAGAAPLSAFSQVVHEMPMLSLDNAFVEADVIEFDRRIRTRLESDEQVPCATEEPPEAGGLHPCVHNHAQEAELGFAEGGQGAADERV